MALTASPFGFAARKHPSGQTRANAYTILATYNTAIGYGDAVILATDGTITVGTATNDIIGVFAGVQYNDSTGKPTYSKSWPGAVSGATNIIAWVYDDPDNVFEVQVAASGTGYVQAAIGDQADLVAGTVNSLTGQSAQALSATLEGAGAQGQFRIIAFGTDGVYDATLNPFPTVLVQIAQHEYRANKVAV